MTFIMEPDYTALELTGLAVRHLEAGESGKLDL